MRKTRLVILPTKCLHQMGFLLLFLSCPVIGDWGRIRPESENSHNAIQIDREGSCGMERDPPGGLLGFLNEDGSKQCRLSKIYDSNSFTERVFSTRFAGRRVNARRLNEQRTVRTLERRVYEDKNARQTIQKRVDRSKDMRREFQNGIEKKVRSRSAELRRLSSNRSHMRVRSLSLSRMENERAIREEKPVVRNTRQQNERNSRKENERSYLTKRSNERQNEQRRLKREMSNERRDGERTIRLTSERTENERGRRTAFERRETGRLSRSLGRESREFRLESNRRSVLDVNTRKRQSDKMEIQNQRETERRLSLTRRELNDAEMKILENRRSVNIPENRRVRSLDDMKWKSDQIENNIIRSRFDNRRATENRLSISLPLKKSDRNIQERRIDFLNNEEKRKSRRVITATVRRNTRELSEPKMENKNFEDEPFLGGFSKWMGLKTYEGFKTEDWTTNCVIGAVVYFFTTRQIKTV